MGGIYSIDGIIPVIPESTFVHPDAVITGDVIIGEGCYIAPCASLRGDLGRIIVGKGCNVQDNCLLHSFPGEDCVLEDNAHIGHGSVLHGAYIGFNALVGMNSVVMDGVKVGANSIIGAGSFVKAGMQIPERSLVAGSPARIIRTLRDDEIAWKTNGTRVYQELAQRSLKTLEPAKPLRQVEPNRQRVNCDPNSATPLHIVKQQTHEADNT